MAGTTDHLIGTSSHAPQRPGSRLLRLGKTPPILTVERQSRPLADRTIFSDGQPSELHPKQLGIAFTTLFYPFLFKGSISIVRSRNVNIFYYKEQTLTCVEVGRMMHPSGQQHKSREYRLALLPD
ncbi:hypothetical protein TNCV_2582831 [Trichonephila clavipes]|nr:hypothetical protein TNCV_2582831 [Trichonephila clavipes]